MEQLFWKMMIYSGKTAHIWGTNCYYCMGKLLEIMVLENNVIGRLGLTSSSCLLVFTVQLILNLPNTVFLFSQIISQRFGPFFLKFFLYFWGFNTSYSLLLTVFHTSGIWTYISQHIRILLNIISENAKSPVDSGRRNTGVKDHHFRSQKYILLSFTCVKRPPLFKVCFTVLYLACFPKILTH